MNRVAGKAAESFARLPWRITEAFTRDELTRDEYLLLVYLVAKIYHDVWKLPSDRQVLVTELAIIKAETNSTTTTARLGQVLKELREKGWIGYRSRSGSKKWEIWLTGASVVEDGEKTARSGSPDFELSLKQSEPGKGAIPDGERESADFEAQNRVDALEVEAEVEQEQTKELSKGTAVGEATSRTREDEPAPDLLPDVLEAVNRARASRGEQPLSRRPSFYDPISDDDLALLDRFTDETFRTEHLPPYRPPPQVETHDDDDDQVEQLSEPVAPAPTPRQPLPRPSTGAEIDELIASSNRMIVLSYEVLPGPAGHEPGGLNGNGNSRPSGCPVAGCDCGAATLARHEQTIEQTLAAEFDAHLVEDTP